MSQKTALIVEDDKDEGVLFSKALELAGFKTEIIWAGDAALEKLAAEVPDMVLLDLHLPRISGIEILSQIRADPRLDKVRVIVITGDPEKAEVVEEADVVLVKPTRFDQLRDEAENLFDEE